MASRDSHERLGGLAALGLDPDALLMGESRVLVDARFTGALHAELEREFGPEEARITLLQIGFLHGLQGASRAMEGADAAFGAAAEPGFMPPLAIRLRSQPRARPEGGLEIRGSWPQCCEASARLAKLGVDEESGCHLSAGYTSGWLTGMLDASILALETTCSATGARECGFVAREAAAWRSLGDERAAQLLDALPFEAFRGMVAASFAALPDAPPRATGGFEAGSAAVHIWGPVMVIPFAGPDEALRAVDLIGRDRDASDVSVVEVDLTGAVVDEAFGAVALEQLVDAVGALGAETIFAGASPISERVVAELELPPVLIHKDLDHAIAAAFQIAEAQRRVV